MVGQDLGEGESGLDGETNTAQEADIGFRVGDRGQVDDGQDGGKIGQEQPVPTATNVSASSAASSAATEKSFLPWTFLGRLTASCSSTAKSHMVARIHYRQS